MKILTLNTHSYLEENQMEKLDYLAHTIKERNYDVVALQEVNQLSSKKVVQGEVKEDNFLLLLCEKLKTLGLNYNFTWDYHHVGYDIYDEGTGILFKGEALDKGGEFIGLCTDTNFWKTRKFSFVSLNIQGEIIDFYSCHLGWWMDKENPFHKQIDDLLDFAKKRKNRFFLMGDFNNSAEVSNEGYDYLSEKGILDTYNLALENDFGVTIPGVIAGWEDKCSLPKRIDFIFTNKDVLVENSFVIFNGKNKEIISDHFGVEIEIRV